MTHRRLGFSQPFSDVHTPVLRWQWQVTPTVLVFSPNGSVDSSFLNEPWRREGLRDLKAGIRVMCYSRAAVATAAAAAAEASHLVRLHHFFLTLHRGVVGSGNKLPTPPAVPRRWPLPGFSRKTDCLEESPKTVPIGDVCLRKAFSTSRMLVCTCGYPTAEELEV